MCLLHSFPPFVFPQVIEDEKARLLLKKGIPCRNPWVKIFIERSNGDHDAPVGLHIRPA